MMKTAGFAALLLLCYLTISTATAAVGWFGTLNRGPMTQFNDDDVAMFMEAGGKALDSTPDGGSESWKNEATGNHGTIKALKTIEIDGKHCRLMQVENQSRSYFNRAKLTFCRQEDGSWYWEPTPQN
jgi:surface antigen